MRHIIICLFVCLCRFNMAETQEGAYYILEYAYFSIVFYSTVPL